MPHEGERVYMETQGVIVWGTVLGAVDDGRLMIAWDEGNPLGWEASFGVHPDDVQAQTPEAA
jgi:hypothetical protein